MGNASDDNDNVVNGTTNEMECVTANGTNDGTHTHPHSRNCSKFNMLLGSGKDAKKIVR